MRTAAACRRAHRRTASMTRVRRTEACAAAAGGTHVQSYVCAAIMRETGMLPHFHTRVMQRSELASGAWVTSVMDQTFNTAVDAVSSMLVTVTVQRNSAVLASRAIDSPCQAQRQCCFFVCQVLWVHAAWVKCRRGAWQVLHTCTHNSADIQLRHANRLYALAPAASRF